MTTVIAAVDFPQRMRRALQAIGLVVFAVLFNFGFYVLVSVLISQNIIRSNSSFPPLLLFLSFALSVGIILIIGLGERVDTKNIKNEWVRKVGVSPIMIIVATLLSILGAFSLSFKDTIIASESESDLKFMLANIGVTCAAREGPRPQAESLLTVISGDESYIRLIKEFLRDKNQIRSAKNPKIEFVKQEDDNDAVNSLIFAYAHSQEAGSESLLSALDSEDRWVAYTVRARDPGLQTSIPVPAMYDRSHKTWLFVIVIEPPPTNRAEVDSLAAPIKSKSSRDPKRLLPLFQVGITPKRPLSGSQLTDLDVKAYPYNEHVCWHIKVLPS